MHKIHKKENQLQFKTDFLDYVAISQFTSTANLQIIRKNRQY